MEKKKISVDIAGNPITLVTDEPEELVSAITETINTRIAELTRNSFRVSTLDAALLLAVDYLGQTLKSQAQIRTLEAQLSVTEVNLRKAENALMEINDKAENRDEGNNNPDTGIARLEKELTEENISPESRIRALEKYLDRRKTDQITSKTREEKISYIEALLREKEENGNAAKEKN